MKKIIVSDFTLRQSSAVSFREKTAIAACADSLGADAVELAPIRSVREDTIIYRTIAQNCAHSIVAVPVGFTEEEVEAAWACVKDAKAPQSFQFMRMGYFCPDSKDSAPDHLVFNRSVGLKDSFKHGK